jgi:hypothetical protein
MHRSKQHPYSITSSAATNSLSGTVGPSALAILVDDQLEPGEPLDRGSSASFARR